MEYNGYISTTHGHVIKLTGSDVRKALELLLKNQSGIHPCEIPNDAVAIVDGVQFCPLESLDLEVTWKIETECGS